MVKAKQTPKKDEENIEVAEEGLDSEVQQSNKKRKLATPVKEEKPLTSPTKVTQQIEKNANTSQTPSNKSPKSQGDKDRKAELDARTLFVKNLPINCSIKEIKALSTDIKLVRMRINHHAKKQKSSYAYVEFANEITAEKNKPILEAASLKGNNLIVDFVGGKSQFKKDSMKKEHEEINPLRLYIAGLSADVTEADLRKLFPKAQEINIPSRKKNKKHYGYAFATFASAELAKEYHDKTQEANLKGINLVVLYAKKQNQVKQETSKKTKEIKIQNKNKKEIKKKEPEKMEAEDDDDEEEDDDEDDDEDEDADNDEGEEDDDDDDEDDDDDDEDDDDDDEDDDDE
ncbi:hypothetical protein Btru_070847 [Bulinus truncatus]|nr:hypothetical protein Btru_070847 [Bulinus truncatus]